MFVRRRKGKGKSITDRNQAPLTEEPEQSPDRESGAPLEAIVSAFNRARPSERFCPKCGAGIYDPFGWGRLVHDVKSCLGR
jgi:hypothetical protein